MSIRLSIPAQPEYLALARSMAAASAMRADLPVDRLEDLRLAVDEAAAALMLDAEPAATLECVFDESGDTVEVTLSTGTRTGALPSDSSFGWRVMSALVDVVAAHAQGTRVTIALTMRGAGA